MWTVRAYDIGETDAQLMVDLTEQSWKTAWLARNDVNVVIFPSAECSDLHADCGTKYASRLSGGYIVSIVNEYPAV